MFLWIYDLPDWVLFLIFTVAALGLSWALVFVLRPVMRRWSGDGADDSHNHTVELVAAGTGLLYGLLLGLIAVATYSTYADTQKIIDDEANALGGFARDASFYPEPLRGQVQNSVKEYIHYVVTEAWPQQRRGEIPGGGVERITTMYRLISAYEPPSAGTAALQSETISQFNKFIENHRKRLAAVRSGLPASLWTMLVIGALVNLVLIAMPAVRSLRLHLTLTGILALMIGSVIFLIAAMDNPFLGDFSIEPTSYEVVRDQLVNRI
ncbi:DUF4239 domain-containing protein [Actinocrispum wychmicini]|uniref:Uncharacterized protein DUF4239 n=1 Tax=Actinocrispum wychmicini TaxID=1213861 RepID=A0A4R2JE50_9PSEU|nr:DUF4239 domain-containing protein [Actinocrispum wychmicini]TCO55088.1 uncharacterized protein DUF4239 [Actinocrispum wychmicini]